MMETPSSQFSVTPDLQPIKPFVLHCIISNGLEKKDLEFVLRINIGKLGFGNAFRLVHASFV